MSHTEFITRCGTSGTEIPLTNTTNTFGTTVSYKLTILNSDANKTEGSVLFPGTWSSTLPNYLDIASTGALASAVGGNYYIARLSVRSSCSSGNGSYVQGHFRYLTSATTESSNFKLLPYVGGGGTNYNRVTNILPYASLPAEGAITGGITGVYTTGYVTAYRVRIQQVNCSTGTAGIALVDNTLNSINGAIPDAKYFSEYAMDPDGIGVGSTATQTNYFYTNYNTIKNNCYKVIVNTISGGCSSTSADVWSYFRIAQGGSCPLCRTNSNENIDDEKNIITEKVKVYPNPVDNLINFDVSSAKEESALIRITDLQGKEIFGLTIPIQIGINNIELPTNDIPSGLYLYEVKTSDNTFTGKLVKK